MRPPEVAPLLRPLQRRLQPDWQDAPGRVRTQHDVVARGEVIDDNVVKAMKGYLLAEKNANQAVAAPPAACAPPAGAGSAATPATPATAPTLASPTPSTAPTAATKDKEKKEEKKDQDKKKEKTDEP
jgi:hypothetical protein